MEVQSIGCNQLSFSQDTDTNTIAWVPGHYKTQFTNFSETPALIASLPIPPLPQTQLSNFSLDPNNLLKHEIIFIDPTVSEDRSLFNDLFLEKGVNGDLVFLDADQDGVQQISNVLSQYHNLSGIHILSHGQMGSLQLGSTTLNQTSLGQYSTLLPTWQQVLLPNADILLYGCNVAATEAGQSFVQQLSNLTGLDVAASEDLTGAEALGGDWNLEYQTGSIETKSIALGSSFNKVLEYVELNGSTLFFYADDTRPDSNLTLSLDGSGNLLIEDAINPLGASSAGNVITNITNSKVQVPVSSFQEIRFYLAQGNDSVTFQNFSLPNLVNFEFHGATFTVGGTLSTQGGNLTATAESIAIGSNAVLSTEGGDLTITADESITINSDAILSTRQITGAVSNGNSGTIAITGPEIEVNQGAQLLADVVGTTQFTAGAIQLTATGEGISGLRQAVDQTVNLVDVSTPQSSITLDGAILKGGDIQIQASTEDSNVPEVEIDDLGSAIGSSALNELKQLLQSAGSLIPAKVSVEIGNSAITVNDGTQIISSKAVTIASKVEVTNGLNVSINPLLTSTPILGQIPLAVAFAWGNATATTTFNGAVNIQAVTDITVKTSSDNTINPSAAVLKNLAGTPQNANALGLALAFAVTKTTAQTTINQGATLTAQGNIRVESEGKAETTSTAETGIFQDGRAAGAIGFQYATATIQTLVDGTLTAKGAPSGSSDKDEKDGITISATLESKDKTVAEAGIEDEQPEKVDALKLGSVQVAKLLDFVKTKQKTANPNTEAHETEAGATAENNSGETRVSSSLAFAEVNNTVIAEVGSHAVLQSNSDLTVQASLSETMQISAEGGLSANPDGTSVAAAVSAGIYNNTAKALVDSGAQLDAKESTQVTATVEYPSPISQFDWSEFLKEFPKSLGENLGILPALKNNVFNSFVRTNSESAEGKSAVAGSINYLNFANVTEATIVSGAKVNQQLAFQTPDQSVTVNASTKMNLVNMTGIFDLNLGGITLSDLKASGDRYAILLDKLKEGNSAGAGGEGKGAVGGSFSIQSFNNTTTATIQGGAQVHIGTESSQGLQVNATTEVHNISLTQAGASGEDYAVSGSIAYLDHQSQTQAQIASGAQISGGEVTVNATDDTNHINVAGDIASGENKGVGVSIGINSINRKTDAFIGNSLDDLSQESSQPTMIDVAGDIQVSAEATGAAYVFALAAAKLSKNNPPEKALKNPQNENNALEGVKTSSEDDSLDGINITPLFEDVEEGDSLDGVNIVALFEDGGPTEDQKGVDLTSVTKTASQGTGESASVKEASADVGQQHGEGKAGIGISGDVSINVINDTARAYINDSGIVRGKKLAVTATNTTALTVAAGSAALTQKAESEQSTGLAGSVSVNLIEGNTKAFINQAQLTVADLSLGATRSGDIYSLTAGGAGAPTSGKAIAGSVSLNLVTNSSTETWLDGVKGTIASGGTTLQASDTSGIYALAGAVSSGGKAGIGAAFGFNLIDTTTLSQIRGNTNLAYGNGLTVTADSDNSILALAFSAGASSGGTAVAGTISTNFITSVTDAAILTNSTLTGSGAITIAANGSPVQSTIRSLAGVGAKGEGGGAYGVAAAYNAINSTTTTRIDQSSVTTRDGAVSLTAQTDNLIQTIAAGIGGSVSGSTTPAGNAGVGSIAINNIHGGGATTYIGNNASVSAAQNISLNASDNSVIQGLVGGLALKGQNGAGAAIGINYIGNTVQTYIDTATVESQSGAVSLNAIATAEVDILGLGLANADQFALGGTVMVNILNRSIGSQISNAQASNGQQVKASQAITVNANNASLINSLAAGLGFAGQTGVGASLGVNVIDDNLFSVIDNASVLSTGGQVAVTANSSAVINAIAIGGAKGGSFALGGSVAVNILDNNTGAAIRNNSAVTGAQGVRVVVDENNTQARQNQIQQQLGVSLPGPFNANALSQTGINTLAGAFDKGTTAVGAAVVVNVLSNNFWAYIDNSVVTAPTGDVQVSANSLPNLKTLAVGAGGGGSLAVEGSIVVGTVTNTIDAHITNGAKVTAGGNVQVSASDTLDVDLIAGALGIGDATAVGIASTTLITDNTTTAYVAGSTTQINAGANGQAVSIPTGNVTVPTLNGQGVIVTAISQEDILTLAGAGAGSDGAAVGGSVTVTVLNETTSAYVGQGVQINSQVANASSNQGILVQAIDSTTLTDVAGAFAGGAGTGVAGGVATAVITKNTQAYLGANATVQARNNVQVQADSVNDLNVVAASLGIAEGAGVAAAVGVFVVNDTTQAYVGNNATVTTDGSVSVNAQNQLDLDVVAGSIDGAGGTGVGASVSVPVIIKNTNAYLADGAKVTANGNSNVLTTTGTFNTTNGPSSVPSFKDIQINATADTINLSQPHGFTTGQAILYNQGSSTSSIPGLVDGQIYYAIVVDSQTVKLATTQDNAKNGVAIDLKNPLLAGTFTLRAVGDFNLSSVVGSSSTNPITHSNQKVTPSTTTVQGIVVNATNLDKITTIAAAGGGAAGVAVDVGAAVYVLDNKTTASVGKNTQVTSRGNNAGLYVMAGDSLLNFGVAGSFAAAGGVGVGAGVGVSVVNRTVEAVIQDAAQVQTSGDVWVNAGSTETITLLSASASFAGTAAGAGSVSTLVLNDKTYAHVGNSTNPGSGAVINANGSVWVSANDSTNVSVLAGGVAAGLSGVGAAASVGVLVVNKDTQAFLSGGAIVNARANTPFSPTVYNGVINADNSFGTGLIQGVAVQASSAENLSTQIASGGVSGLVGLAGAVAVASLNSDTQAYITGKAQVNQGVTGANAKQSVNVSAVNQVNGTARVGNLAAGLAGLGGAVDVGTIANDTQAYIDTAQVFANQDIDVYALNSKNITSTVLNGAVGGLAISGAVSVYGVGQALDGNQTAYLQGNNQSLGSYVDQGTDPSQNGASGLLRSYNKASLNSSNFSNNIVLLSNHNFQTGQVVVYDSGNSPAIGGLTSGNQYFVTVVDKNRFQLSAVQGGPTIAFGGVTGNTHTLTAASSSTSASQVRQATAQANQQMSSKVPTNAASASLGNSSANRGSGAYISNAIIQAGGTVNVVTNEQGTVNLNVGEAALGAAAIGVSVGIANVNPSLKAYVGNSTTLQATNLNIQSHITPQVSVQTTALSGGIVSGAGSIAQTNITSNSSASIGSNSTVTTTQAVTIQADTVDQITTLAEGVNAGAAGTGVSQAITHWNPTVFAAIGPQSKVQAGSDVVVRALGNVSTPTSVSDPGKLIGNKKITTTANASSGSLINSSTGATADLATNTSITALLDDNVTVSAGGTVTLLANGHTDAETAGNSVTVQWVGSGSPAASSTINHTVQARTGNSVNVKASNLNVLGWSNHSSAVNATGVDSSTIDANDGATATNTLNNQTLAILGQNNTIATTAQTQVAANNLVNVQSNAIQDAGSLLTTNKTSATTTINSFTKSDVGRATTVNAGQFSLLANNTTLPGGKYGSSIEATAKSTSDSDAGQVSSSALINLNNFSANASLDADAIVTAPLVTLSAVNAPLQITSFAYSYGKIFANNFAQSIVQAPQVGTTVSTASGSQINTKDLTVTSTVQPSSFSSSATEQGLVQNDSFTQAANLPMTQFIHFDGNLSITADSLTDEIDGNSSQGNWSLREAINEFNVLQPVNTSTQQSYGTLLIQSRYTGQGNILFGSNIARGTINLVNTLPLLTVKSGMNLQIDGGQGITLSGNPNLAFLINVEVETTQVVLNHLNITGSSNTGLRANANNPSASITLLNSTIHSNGLGLEIGLGAGQIILNNSTISSNNAGVIVDGSAPTVTINNSTITNNQSFGIKNPSGARVFVYSSIIAGNQATDVTGTLESRGYNLIGIGSTGGFNQPTDQVGITSPKLAPLADNGGATLTHALLPGSPALDRGDNLNNFLGDQRGAARIFNVIPDIGAFESGISLDSPIAPILTTLPVTSQTDFLFQVSGIPGTPITLQFAWTVREADYNNEIGFFVVDDAEGRINGMTPGTPGYAQAALRDRRQLLFKSGEGAGTYNELKAVAGNYLIFYLVQNTTSAQWLARNPQNQINQGPLVFFSSFATLLNPDKIEHILVTDLKDGGLQFSWEDLTGEDGDDWDDVVFNVYSSDFVVPGTPGQTVNATISRTSRATYQSEIGFILLDDITGAINGLLPSSPGYAQAALSSSNRVVVFNSNNTNPYTVAQTNVPSGKYLAWYLIQNGSTAQFLSRNPQNLVGKGPLAFFSFAAANPFGLPQIRRALSDTFIFEEQEASANQDFDDYVIDVRFQ